jgi:hypothetical protein
MCNLAVSWRLVSCTVWCCMVGQKVPDVSKDDIFIFRVQQSKQNDLAVLNKYGGSCTGVWWKGFWRPGFWCDGLWLHSLPLTFGLVRAMCDSSLAMVSTDDRSVQRITDHTRHRGCWNTSGVLSPKSSFTASSRLYNIFGGNFWACWQNCEKRLLASSLNVQGPVHREYMPLIIQRDATIYSLFISVNCSTCFG